MSARYMRTCVGKIRHGSRKAARDHMIGLIRNGSPTGMIQTYHCKQCNGYHVGHRSSRGVKRRKKR